MLPIPITKKCVFREPHKGNIYIDGELPINFLVYLHNIPTVGLSIHAQEQNEVSARLNLCRTLPKPHSVLVGESAHQSIMLQFSSSQPPTIWYHPANNISQYGSVE
ncbi:hypothetical protein AVEN_189490-1 [Araneus ventricosus]|uniref:Uncharacterized protein n=1 Tax=Araneus ventricosus TaxID=182803 RepID=A0A4Y2D6K1_ARAVE|nr:hypothetical protein AVEN_189490-1 [Araneus ventricosus]